MPNKRSPKQFVLSLLAALVLLLIIIMVLMRRPLLPVVPHPFDTLHPHTQRVFRELGIEPQHVTQGLGHSPASAGIHGVDGYVNGRLYCAAFDLSVADLTPSQTRSLLHKLRRVGFVCWWRVPGVSFPATTSQGIEAGPHIHGIDPFVPHKRRLEMQIRDYMAGKNGIEVGTYAHRPDPAAVCPQTVVERKLLDRKGSLWQLELSRSK